MADERTEQATPRRREEARRRGEIPRSAELAGAAALLGALAGLRLCWPGVVQSAADTVRSGLRDCVTWSASASSVSALVNKALLLSAAMAGPAAAGACVAALAANLAQAGFVVTGQPLAFNWNRLSISQGFLRMFSRRGLFSAARSLLKVGAVAIVTFVFVRSRWAQVLQLSQGSAASAGASLGGLTWGLLVQVGAVLSLAAAADYVFQRREFEKNLRMTRRELRDEHKRTEGDPLIRSRLRERMRSLARHRMLQAVKKATVVVVNPVEIAVALKYEMAKTPAPVVVAKGRHLMAQRIRDEAERHGVPIARNEGLARAIYRSVPVGRQIPPELYQAVAEILAFVYRMTRRGRP